MREFGLKPLFNAGLPGYSIGCRLKNSGFELLSRR